MFKPRGRKVELEEKLKLQNKTVFAYIGTHGMAHGLNFILDSIKPLERDSS